MNGRLTVMRCNEKIAQVVPSAMNLASTFAVLLIWLAVLNLALEREVQAQSNVVVSFVTSADWPATKVNQGNKWRR